jgi:hypothetical protein
VKSNPSQKFKRVTIISEVREIPRHKMAQVDASIFFWREIPGECAGVEIIHVLVYPDIGWYECIKEQKVQVGEKVKAFFRDINVCI